MPGHDSMTRHGRSFCTGRVNPASEVRAIAGPPASRSRPAHRGRDHRHEPRGYGRPSLMRPAAPGSRATPATFAASAAATATLGPAVPTRIAEVSIVGGQLVPVLSGQVVEVVHDLPVPQGQLASQPLRYLSSARRAAPSHCRVAGIRHRSSARGFGRLSTATEKHSHRRCNASIGRWFGLSIGSACTWDPRPEPPPLAIVEVISLHAQALR